MITNTMIKTLRTRRSSRKVISRYPELVRQSVRRASWARQGIRLVRKGKR